MKGAAKLLTAIMMVAIKVMLLSADIVMFE
jgi:hypothetical protein